MSAEFRIVAYLCFTVLLFLLPDLRVYGILLACLTVCLAAVPLRTVKAGWLPILLFLSFTFLSNLFFGTGRIIAAAGAFRITDRGLALASLRTLRLLLMIGGVKFLMARTDSVDMVRGMARLLSPLRRTGLPVDDFFETMGLTLRCFPILKERISALYSRMVRDGRAGGLLDRTRAMALFMVPLFVESLHNPEQFFGRGDDAEGI